MSEKKLPDATEKNVDKVLKKLGFHVQREGRKHRLYKKGNTRIPVPRYGSKSIPKGTLRAILKSAGITNEEFNKLRK